MSVDCTIGMVNTNLSGSKCHIMLPKMRAVFQVGDLMVFGEVKWYTAEVAKLKGANLS